MLININLKKFQSISNLTISADPHGILAPEESLIKTGKTSSHVLKNTLFRHYNF